MARNQGATPAQQGRARLAAAIRERGESPYNLWLVRPPFDDEGLILSSDPALELFYWLEGNPDYFELDYSPLRTPSANRPWHEALLFARATARDGCSKTVYLARGPLGDPGHHDPQFDQEDRLLIGVRELDANALRIRNWRRIIPCIRRVQSHPTRAIRVLIKQYLSEGERHSIRSVIDALGDTNVALLLGSIATLLRRRQIASDCDTRPWSLNTLVWDTSP